MRYDLYIDGKLCDLDDSSLIVLTYTMEQLTNPTAVKNTYSHEVELPSTERNDILFSHYYRNDYLVSIGNFSPIKRVPFTIYNELGEIAESGYIKLDEVHVDKMAHTYKVILYGGLGSFFYMLGYTDNGDVLKLSDLQYMTANTAESLLNIRLLRSSIDQYGAWGRLLGNNSRQQYDVINFAPTYQGLPDGDFAKDKALFIGRATMSGSSYTNTLRNPIYGISSTNSTNTMYKRLRNGVDTSYRCCIVDLGADHTEWEMKDLRTYLQRPVLSVRKFIEAVQRRATAYGYTFNLDSAFFNNGNPYYNDAWVTLPSLQSISKDNKGSLVQIAGTLNISSESNSQTQEIPFILPNVDSYTFGTELSNVKIQIPQISIQIDYDNIASVKNSVSLHGSYSGWAYIAWFIQAYVVDNGGVVQGTSNVAVLYNGTNLSAEEVAQSAGFSPISSATTTSYNKILSYFYKQENGVFRCNSNIELSIPNAPSGERILLRVEKRRYNNTSDTVPVNIIFSDTTDLDSELPDYCEYYGTDNNVFGTANVASLQTIRSGVIVPKSLMLDIGKSPLELLLSYCKLFGLVWHYESNSNTITLQQRTTFYNEGTAVDWSERIDRNKEIKIKPFEFDKRFYDFELETQGEWAEQYADKYGRPYGAQRVNTGYDFDKEAKNLLEGNALKGGAEVLEQGKYYNNITQGTYTLGSTTYDKICPSVFLDGGKYALYDTNGNPTEYDVITPTNEANIEYMNPLQGYDAQPKAQLHKDNKLESEGGMLLLYTGSIDVDNSPYKNFRLTDDIAEMGLLNEGQLCWVLEGSSVGSLSGETIPKFVRTGYNLSLDMGVPLELDNPDVDTEAVQNSIYSQYWRDYLGDRYDTNSRVCECYVDLRGLQVSNALFRNFYYFDNAVWVLNKIANYSMTTEGSTLCEFVKVQDVKNYKGE